MRLLSLKNRPSSSTMKLLWTSFHFLLNPNTTKTRRKEIFIHNIIQQLLLSTNHFNLIKMLLSFGANEDGQCGRHNFNEDEEEGYGSESIIHP
jgi:hypothetical protein